MMFNVDDYKIDKLDVSFKQDLVKLKKIHANLAKAHELDVHISQLKPRTIHDKQEFYHLVESRLTYMRAVAELAKEGLTNPAFATRMQDWHKEWAQLVTNIKSLEQMQHDIKPTLFTDKGDNDNE